MANQESATQYGSVPTHEIIPANTVGEVSHWLTDEAVGNSARAASYLDKLRSLAVHVDERNSEGKQDSFDDFGNVYTLAGSIARQSESRLREQAEKNGGKLPAEIDGVVPVHEVSEQDIAMAASQFDPMSDDYKGYVNSLEIEGIHSIITNLVNQELEQQDNTE